VVKKGWHRKLSLEDKVKLLHELEGLGGKRSRKLVELGIPSSTYDAWQTCQGGSATPPITSSHSGASL
jgi:phage gp16-like protein